MNKPLLVVLILLVSASTVHACIWDRDTLAMERARFPQVNELIVGYFPRHSPAYYEWRKKQVLAIDVEERTPSDYDDLGASYDKLGEHKQAIATMLEKIKRFPDQSLYETHANLGTFYIHNGDLEQGVQYIGSAIEINPDAHFGREVYQKLLVEYVIQQRAAGNALPLTTEFVHPWDGRHGFSAYVLNRPELADSNQIEEQAEIDKATKGILGMMRFGSYDSPVLLEALGDLLAHTGPEEGGQRLAARAYLKASIEVDDQKAKQIYLDKAKAALHDQQGVAIEEIESKLRKEIEEGDIYFAQIEADEKAWIEAGEDVDALFINTYYENQPGYSQSILGRTSDRFRVMPLEHKMLLLVLAVGASILIGVVILVVRIRRMRARGHEIAAKLQA